MGAYARPFNACARQTAFAPPSARMSGRRHPVHVRWEAGLLAGWKCARGDALEDDGMAGRAGRAGIGVYRRLLHGYGDV